MYTIIFIQIDSKNAAKDSKNLPVGFSAIKNPFKTIQLIFEIVSKLAEFWKVAQHDHFFPCTIRHPFSSWVW